MNAQEILVKYIVEGEVAEEGEHKRKQIEERVKEWSTYLLSTYVLAAMKEIAELSFDAGWRLGHADGADILDIVGDDRPTKEEFINQSFK